MIERYLEKTFNSKDYQIHYWMVVIDKFIEDYEDKIDDDSNFCIGLTPMKVMIELSDRLCDDKQKNRERSKLTED